MKGLSSKQAVACAQYLRKKHGIDEELFRRVHDDLVVIEQVGFESAEQELSSLQKYADHFEQLTKGEKKHILKNPKLLYKHEQEEISLEENLIRLLRSAKKELGARKQETLIQAINQLINRLQAVISLEEQELAKMQ